MDDLELIRSFRRDEALPNPVAREAARDRLVAHIAESRPAVEPGVRTRARIADRDRDAPLIWLATRGAAVVATAMATALIAVVRSDHPPAQPSPSHGIPGAVGAVGPQPPSFDVTHRCSGSRRGRRNCDAKHLRRFVYLALQRPGLTVDPPDRAYLQADQVRFERELAIADAVYGPAHSAGAVAAANLSDAQVRRDDIAAARASLKRAIAILEQRFGPNDVYPQLARSELRGMRP